MAGGGHVGCCTDVVGLTRLDRATALYFVSAIVGAATVALGLGQSVASLVAADAAMGFSVWLCHIMIVSRVMAAAGTDNIGRADVGINLVISGSAAVMCLYPALVQRSLSGDYLVAWGLLVLLVSVAVGVRALRQLTLES